MSEKLLPRKNTVVFHSSESSYESTNLHDERPDLTTPTVDVLRSGRSSRVLITGPAQLTHEPCQLGPD